MTAFSSILLAYDGSQTANRAAETASRLASAFSSKVEVVHVLELPQTVPTVEPVMMAENSETVEGMIRETSWEVLEQSLVWFDPANRPQLALLRGAPGPVIVEHAKERNFDLIVVGHRGLNRFEQFFLGSVSQYVTRHADCAVLVVKDEGTDEVQTDEL